MSRASVRVVRAGALIGAGVMTIAALSGCDGSSSAADKAVREARITLQTLSIGGSNAGGGASSVTRAKAYQQIVTSLSGLSPTKPTQKATVSALLARGQAGLAEIEVEKATSAEAAVLRSIVLVHTALDQWFQQSSTASALEQFEITEATTQIDTKVGELKSELAAAGEELRQSERVQADLSQQIEAARKVAAEHRAKENQVRQQMVTADEVQRLSLLEEASQYRRQADEQEREAGHIEAELVSVKPETEAKRREVARLETTIRLMQQTRATLDSKAEATDRAAGEARTDAQQGRTKLTERLAALEEARTQVTEPWTKAIGLYGKAASAIQQGGGVNKDKGLDKAAYFQLAADAQWALSRSHAGYAALMNRLAKTEGLDGGFAAKAEAATAESEAARQAAAELYQQAVDSLGGVQEPAPVETPEGTPPAAGAGAAPAAPESLANRLDALRKKIAIVEEAPVVEEPVPAEPAPTDEVPTDEPAATDAPVEPGMEEPAAEEPVTDEPPAETPEEEPQK